MKKTLFFLCSGFLFFSCSLKYDEVVLAEEKIPELIFQDTQLTRYENNKVTLELNAGVLEQYKNSSETFAKGVNFSAYDDDGKLSTKGACGLLMTNTDSELYELYDGIELFSQSEKVNFYADVLKWNAKSEQLTSGRGDMVKIEKDDATIRGTGFAASGISKNFSFRGTVTGEIETKNDEEKSEN